ncbi:MAG: aspartate/glutamate racemase family protein [Microcoleaceae cyanobacterium]
MYQTIGIIGGLSPESTANYYLSIVRQHFKHFGNHRYPPIKIASVCYQDYTDWRLNHQWDIIGQNLSQECTNLANAGADFVLISCNAMHKALPFVRSPIPILSIVDVAAATAKSWAIDTLVLTGTQFTMTDGFLGQQLGLQGMTVLTPDIPEQTVIERIIRTELTLGKALPESATVFAQAVQNTMTQNEYQSSSKSCGVLLACTELSMLMPYFPSDLKCLDTASLHAMSAWQIATGQLLPHWQLQQDSNNEPRPGEVVIS